jgi:hypothetical protein
VTNVLDTKLSTLLSFTDLNDVGGEDVEGEGFLGVENGGHLNLEAALCDRDLLFRHHLHANKKSTAIHF